MCCITCLYVYCSCMAAANGCGRHRTHVPAVGRCSAHGLSIMLLLVCVRWPGKRGLYARACCCWSRSLHVCVCVVCLHGVALRLDSRDACSPHAQQCTTEFSPYVAYTCVLCAVTVAPQGVSMHAFLPRVCMTVWVLAHSCRLSVVCCLLPPHPQSIPPTSLRIVCLYSPHL